MEGGVCMYVGAVFQALITVIVMCSLEMHKCKHGFAMGI